jgi:hypothetical protein
VKTTSSDEIEARNGQELLSGSTHKSQVEL